MPERPPRSRPHRSRAGGDAAAAMFAIAAGYEDANDCNKLRDDPVFKMAVGRAPESGEALCSQPTMSRLENAPSKIEIARLMRALVDQFCASYSRAPVSIIL